MDVSVKLAKRKKYAETLKQYSGGRAGRGRSGREKSGIGKCIKKVGPINIGSTGVCVVTLMKRET
jgi:hypothetical protein